MKHYTLILLLLVAYLAGMYIAGRPVPKPQPPKVVEGIPWNSDGTFPMGPPYVPVPYHWLHPIVF